MRWPLTETASDLQFLSVGLTVCWFRTSATDVSRHTATRCLRSSATTRGSMLGRCRGHVEGPPGHHRPVRRAPDPAPRSPPATAYTAPGSTSSRPATRPRATPRFEPRSRRPKTSPNATPPAAVDLVLRLRKELTDGRPGRRRRTPSAGTCPPPPDHRVPGHDQPDPDPRRRWSPRTREATEVLLPPVRGRDAQRDLAVRLHPLPAHPPDGTPGTDSRSSPGSTTTPATPCTSPPTAGSPPRSCWPPSDKPLTCTDTPHPRSPTTAWSTPSGSPAGRGGRNAFEAELRDWTSSRRTPAPTTPPPAARSRRFQQTLKKWLRAQPVQPTTIAELQALLDALRRGVQPPPAAPVPARTEPPPRPPTTRMPKATPAATAPPTPTTGSATTRVDNAGTVTLRSPADYATSASAEPTPEPASSCSSRTSTSASSTPPPANSSATSPSTPAATTSPPEHPRPTRTEMNNTRTYIRRSGCRRCPETSHCRADRI